jgi:putative DNA primase/helicase
VNAHTTIDIPIVPAALDLTSLRVKMWMQGYRPVPVLRHDAKDKSAGKRPTMPQWEIVCASAHDEVIRKWTTDRKQRECTNTGLLCGMVTGVDIDILDPDLAMQVQVLADAMLPATPLLRIGKAPKSLRVFQSGYIRAKVSTPALILPSSIRVQVEALGTRNQFVSFGIHPETRQPYFWPGASPLDVPLADLPVLSDEVLHAFLAEAEAVMRAAGGRTEAEIKGATAPPVDRKPRPARSAAFPPPIRQDVEEALKAVPNVHDWHGWVKIGAAIFDALADDGEDLFAAWSAQSSRDDPAATKAKWKSFRRSPMTTTEATLFWEARRNGWKPAWEIERDERSKNGRAPEPPPPDYDDGPWSGPDEPPPDLDYPGYLETCDPDGECLKIELPPDFSIGKKGVFHHVVGVVDGEKKPTSEWVCAPLCVTAETQDETNNNWGLLLEWHDRDEKTHKWSMPRKLLHETGNPIASELEDAGLSVGTDQRSHNLLKKFLAGITVNRRLRCVGRTGWHAVNDGHVYVLSDTESFGPGAKGVILQSDRIAAARTAPETCGTLADWQDQVARYAVKNYRIGLFLAAAFTGPLLEITAEPSGGLHLHGGSQSGKTTALRVAGSVWGQATTKGVIKTWRATANGLEGVAAKATDGLLLLDEIGQANADEVGDIIYQLGNDAGKARAARDGSARASMTWRLSYLSTGEKTVATKMGERGNTVHAGQDVRLVNIPSDAGAGMGVYHDLHGFADGAALSTHLCRATEITAYGTAARAFLDRLAQDRATDPDGLVALIAKRRQAFLDKVLPAGADGQVISVARRFSLIAAAGELATTYGVLNWPENEAFNAAGMGFKAWLTARGGTGAAEDRQAILTVRRFLEQHEESRFRLLLPNTDRQTSEDEIRGGREIVNRVGFRREVPGGWEFLIFPESWKEDVCKGLDPARAAAALHQAGFLDKGDGKNWAKKQRVPGVGLGRFYTVQGLILGEND